MLFCVYIIVIDLISGVEIFCIVVGLYFFSVLIDLVKWVWLVFFMYVLFVFFLFLKLLNVLILLSNEIVLIGSGGREVGYGVLMSVRDLIIFLWFNNCSVILYV